MHKLLSQNLQTQIMQDYNIPRNLTDTLFRDFQLPENSYMTLKNPNDKPPQTLNQSKYRESLDEDFLKVQLSQHSTIVQKKPSKMPSSESTQSRSSEQQPATVPKKVTHSKGGRRKPSKKPEPQPKKQIDIDNQIGQIAEWAEKGAKNNSDEQDFNQAEKVGETLQQIEKRKRIEEKLKTGFNNNSKPGGLQAKLSQLKKQNEAKPINQEKQFSTQRLKQQVVQKQNTKTITEEHENSTQGLVPRDNKKTKVLQQKQESEDDPWQKVNQNTLKQYTEAKQKRKNMSFQSVLSYYQKEFKFNEADIEIGQEQAKQETKKEEPGCLELIFSCFKEQAPKKNNKAIFNTQIAKLLIAISKKQLSNSEEQFFVLKEIWTRLTGQPFSRYGAHWNKIGFQGRDPATDLRSTGVLSILQWLIFIQDHQKLAKQQASWSMQNQFPLALTHIKITGVFLDLLERSSLKGDKWEDFQNCYNALSIGIFKKMKLKFKGGDMIGTLVEQEVRNTKKTFQKDIQAYEKQYKK